MYLGRNRADEGGGMIMGGSGIGGVQWSDYSSFENDDVDMGDGIFFTLLSHLKKKILSI